MACSLQIKALKRLHDKGIISSTREILDHRAFEEMNRDMTEMAVQIYNLQTNGATLFTDAKKEIRYPMQDSYLRKNIRTIYRAIPNEDLFNDLQAIVDNNGQTVKEVNVQVTINFPTDDQIVESDNPIVNKKKLDKLQQEKDDLDNLMNCVWGS